MYVSSYDCDLYLNLAKPFCFVSFCYSKMDEKGKKKKSRKSEDAAPVAASGLPSTEFMIKPSDVVPKLDTSK